MTMKNYCQEQSKAYKKTHLQAKVILAGVLCLISAIVRPYPDTLIDCAIINIWLFGVNSIAYILEHIKNEPHNHDKI